MLTAAELTKLSDELFDYLLKNEHQAEKSEYYFLSAALHHYPEIANMCILAGVNIHTRLSEAVAESQNYRGKTALMIAKAKGHTDIETLISDAANSKTHIGGEIPSPPSTPEQSPVDMQMEMHTYLREYHRRLDFTHDSKNAWDKIINVMDIWEKDEKSPKNPDEIANLRNNLAKRLYTEDGDRVQRLMNSAITDNNTLICKLCMKAGIVLNANLHSAVLVGRLPIAALLIRGGADVNSYCHDNTPLMLAAYYKRLDLIAYLVYHGAKPNLLNRHMATALDYLPAPAPDPLSACVATIRLLLPNAHHVSNHAENSGKLTKAKIEYRGLKNSQPQPQPDERLAPCRCYLAGIMQSRQEVIDKWKASRNTPEGQEKLTAFYQELLQFLQLPENKKGQFYTNLMQIARRHQYTELEKVTLVVSTQLQAQVLNVLRFQAAAPTHPTDTNNNNGPAKK